MITHDALIVGGGLSGLRAAIELNKNNINCAMISKVHPVRSHSVAAQGGINGALNNHHRGYYDSTEKHAFDTIKGSDYLADQDAVAKMTKLAPEIIIEMEHWGCPFSRNEYGMIAQRPFGGAGFPRTAYASDRTGHSLLHTLYERAVRFVQGSERKNMVIYEEWIALKLVVRDGLCHGVIAMNIQTGELDIIKSPIVIFATGGAGRIYKSTTNALTNTGLGMAIPLREGIPLKDMEFVQFHPTCLWGSNILITEGARGEGGFLVNNKGERFLVNYADSSKAMETAPRDIVSRNITKEILAGRGINNSYVHLDLRHLGGTKIKERLPGVREHSMKFVGVDPIDAPIPVHPAMHYTMGGIDVDINCASIVKGFYAAGECSCVSVHGGNRLGGNSLLETIVFGKVAGEHASSYISSSVHTPNNAALNDDFETTKKKLNHLFENSGKEDRAKIQDELGENMNKTVGIYREKEKLQIAVNKINELKKRFKDVKVNYQGKRYNMDLIWTLELEGNLEVAECMAKGALSREESRGSQARLDFPTRDDKNWLKHTIAHLTPDGVKLDYKKVTLGLFEPKERKY